MAEQQTNLVDSKSQVVTSGGETLIDDVNGVTVADTTNAGTASSSAAASSTAASVGTYLEDGDLSTFQSIGQSPLLPPREPLGARIAAIMGRHHALLLTLCVFLLWIITTLPSPWLNEELHPGQLAPHDILAPRDVIVPLLDRTEIASRREEAANLVPPVYNPNPNAQAKALEELYAIITAIRRVAPVNIVSSATPTAKQHSPIQGPKLTAPALAQRAGHSLLTAPLPPAQAERLARFKASVAYPVPTALAVQLLNIPGPRWGPIERAAVNAVRAVYKGGQLRSDVMHEDLATAAVRIDQVMQHETQPPSRIANHAAKLTASEGILAAALARHVAHQPNLIVDERKTARAREQAQNAVRDLYQRIRADTVVVKSGEVITDEKWAQLQAMNLVAPRLDPKIALARLALCLALVTFAASYLAHFHRSLMERPASLWMATMVPVAFLALFRQLLHVPRADLAMVPLAATAAMLLTILLNARVGIVAGFLVSSLCGLMAHADMGLFLVTALSSWIGVLSVAEISSRGQLMVRAPIMLAITNGVLAAAWGTLRDAPSEEILSITLWGAGAGIFSVVATAALAMSLERPFGITTHLRLLELLAPDELVTRRMQAEAPGTYTHSLMVAMLSEAAAKAVGADPLLCRVGGLYHDIGKLRRPHCFVENQGGENIHDKLSPQLSALIILAHVKDGIELGRALRVPQPVIDIIAQHHGTTLVSYFYQRALSQCGGKNCEWDANAAKTETVPATSINGAALPDEASFRYAGPRAQSKEAAIVLLADTIEASARSLPNLTQERLENHIRTMIEQRLQEGELSECELTLRDLGIIEQSFIHVLRGVLHQRIEYPEPGRDFNAEDKEAGRGWVRETLDNSATQAKPGSRGFIERRRAPRADRRRRNKKHNTPGESTQPTASQVTPEKVTTAVANGDIQGHNKTHSNATDESERGLTQSHDNGQKAFPSGTSAEQGTIQHGPEHEGEGQRDLDNGGPLLVIGHDQGTNDTAHSTNGYSNGHINGYTNGHANGRLRSHHTSNGSHHAPNEVEDHSTSGEEHSHAESLERSRA